MDRLFLGVVRLRKATQKHCRSGDVLVSPSELWEIIPSIYDVALGLVGATPGATRRVMCTGQIVVCRARWRLVL